MRSSSTYSSALSIPQLRAQLDGRVIVPGDTDYDAARTTFYGGIDRKPAAIVRTANASEVAQVITLARESGLELAIRSGGHSVAGHSVCDGGIVLDLSLMRTLDVDVERRTAWAQSGLTTGAYTSATAAHGLATGFGDTGSVGIGGITLGGGIGFLARKHGLTIDDLLAAEVVTADGEVLHTDGDTHADLFWAIRGGGGNFGVATKFQFRLHDLPSIVGGILVLPASPQVVHAFVAEAEAAPEELSAIVNVMPAPPMPFLAPEHHGRLVILAFLVYAGPTDPGQRAIAPFRALATPIADLVRPMSYAEMFPPEQEDYHPIAMGRTMFIDAVDFQMAEAVVDHIQESRAQMAVAQFRVLGGAVARVPADATAYAHREQRLMANVAALYGQAEEAPVHEDWLARFASAINTGDNSAYVNFIGAEGEARVRDAYPTATWDRLRTIKQRYDPTNLFRMNHNIPPAGR